MTATSEKTPERLPRLSVPALDALLGVPFKVIDDGFVRVIDYMGTDESIVQAARVSYGAGTKQVRDDRALIRYLLRHSHTTPFEMCELKLHVRVPMDTWRQWIRHRTANVNEYSTRYSVAIDAAQTTPSDHWRLQSDTNRQGSKGYLDPAIGSKLSEEESAFHTRARAIYEGRLVDGVAREQARKDLPLSTYTEAYWKIDLHNLLHFLKLRMDPAAQEEIRAYAAIIGSEIVARWCPHTWEAFQDYQMEGIALTRLELLVLRQLIAGRLDAATSEAERLGLINKQSGKVSLSREGREFILKLRALQIPSPWDE